jgi:hypothetical protein
MRLLFNLLAPAAVGVFSCSNKVLVLTNVELGEYESSKGVTAITLPAPTTPVEDVCPNQYNG